MQRHQDVGERAKQHEKNESANNSFCHSSSSRLKIVPFVVLFYSGFS
jgi:hypothetical protein